MGLAATIVNTTATDKRHLLYSGVEATPGVVHHQFEVCGGPLSAYEAGDSSKPTVVMLHGAMYDEARFTWDQMFPHLAQDYHVYAVDTPRHGKSRPWSGHLGNDRLREILHAGIKHLEIKRFSFVGLSMGGALSIDYASRYPEDVTSMALFEPGGIGDKVDNQLLVWSYIKTPGLLRLLSRQYSKKDHEGMLKLLNSLYVGGSKPTDSDRLAKILQDEARGKHEYGEKDMDDWQIDTIGPFKLKWNLLDRIPLIQCPTLWLRGVESTLVKQHEMERAVQLAKQGNTDASLKLIQNAGHMLPLEQPTQANAAVKDFLERTTS